MTTQSADGTFPSRSKTARFPGQQNSKSGQTRTDRTTVPSESPITDSKRESLIIPPNFLTEPRPAWTEIRDYGRYAPYLGGGHPIVRAAGQAYSYFAMAVALVARLVEWIHERPARASIFWLMVAIAFHIFL
jgi:hypothetical protein